MIYTTMLVSLIDVIGLLGAASLTALDSWDTAARDALPGHVKIWLMLMMLNNLAAIAFLKNHVAARWIFGGFVLSHLLVILGFWKTGTSILAGQVSLFHIIFWTPGIYMLWRKREEIKWVTPYAVWACLAIIFYLGSMTVDVKDAVIFLRHAIAN